MSISVFLSTVSDEFRAYRDQLRGDLTRHNVSVKVQEDFKDLGGDTLDKLDVYIAHCDAVVHLVGDMTGSAADERQQQALLAKYPDLAQQLPPLGEALKSDIAVPYTQWEAWLALYHGKPLFIAKAADSAKRGPEYAPKDTSRAAQAQHLAQLKAMGRHPGCTFANPDNLAKHVWPSFILDLLVKAQVVADYGLTPEQLKQVTEAAVKGATGPLLDRITEISKTLGVTEDAAKTLLKIVGERPSIPDDKLAEALTKVAGDYKRLQAQVAALSPDNPTARGLVDETKPEIDAGHFERARELLRQATQAQIAAAQEAGKLKEKAQAAEDAQMLGAASSTAAEGNVALTERRYEEAAGLFGQAAGYVPSGHASARGGYLLRQADALYRQGDERGDNAALSSSIEAYQAALQEWTRERVPLDWAEAQNNLGIALGTLGERERGTARLEEAVAAYRAALEERTRERVPLDWALTQNNLGLALWRLGQRESGTARLDEAAAAFRAALQEYTRERDPLRWAKMQNNLGLALNALGERESGRARLEEAVVAYRAALEEWTRERVPLDWAATQNNLGIALWRLGERESGTARLDEAVAAYRAALDEWTRERVPLRWAMTQNNLGLALWTLGERESGTARLDEAVAAYRAALEEYARERVPLDWALTQNNLGNALNALGRRERGTARLDEAVAAYRAALEERTREQVPLDWALTQNNLGDALNALGQRESGTVRLEQAVAAFRAALEEWTRERVPLQWAAAQNNLGNALAMLGERESGTARLDEAVVAYRAALEEYTRERDPFRWAACLGNHGGALMLIAERTNDLVVAETAVRQIETAYETLRSGGQEQWSAYFAEQLTKARTIRDRLGGR